jgi:CO dehydrogenase maturation factor
VKVLICGKGGSGKSTTASLIAKNLTAKGYRVLVVDADESNYGLNQQLGLNEPTELLDQIGGKKALLDKMLISRSSGEKTPIFTQDMCINDIPNECISKKDNLYLLQIGKVKHYGEGCACPMGGLSRDFLKHLKLSDKDVTLIDTEAGVEHLGRGLTSEVDLVLAVIDPSYESVKLSKKITEMAKECGKSVYFILNKVDDALVEKIVTAVGKEQVIANIPFTVAVQDKGLSGEPLDIVLPSIAGITDFIITSQKANGAKRQ